MVDLGSLLLSQEVGSDELAAEGMRICSSNQVQRQGDALQKEGVHLVGLTMQRTKRLPCSV